MASALVLGAGMVGRVMAGDLSADFDVALADRSDAALARAKQRLGDVRTITADVGDGEALTRLIAPFDIVLGALPSALGYETLQAVIEAGKSYVDISFMPENALSLDALAKERNVTAVVDCGVAPGMSNLLAGWAHGQLDRCERIDIMVGGLPRERRWPFQYKAGFSPHDVIEEYTRPSRLVEHGEVIVRDALSEPELIHFDGLGTLEAFNTDGLRTLINTLECPFMRERTLRYPGHCELMRIFRATGLFSHEPVNVHGSDVRPIDFTSAVLFPQWMYEEGEEDLTVMRVIVEGEAAGEPKRFEWELLDSFDRERAITSMARTTAYPATIIARQIVSGAITQHGVMPPELLADQLDHVLKELEHRGVRYTPLAA
jgi:lysine 6-dehydrogenase